MINRFANMKLFRPDNPRFQRSLTVTYRPGLAQYPPSLKHGWRAVFVARFGAEKTVVTYRKPRPKPPVERY